MIRLINYVSALALCGAIYGVFTIKQQAHVMQYQLNLLQNELSQEAGSIRVLNAELTYLRAPERVKGLAGQFLKLTAAKSSQVIDDPTKMVDPEHHRRYIFAKTDRSWRYKKASSYVRVTGAKRGKSKAR